MCPVIEMRRLRHFKCIQEVSCHFSRLRTSTTVALKFIDDLALAQKMPFAVADMALDMGEVIEQHCPFHETSGFSKPFARCFASSEKS
jgi:hypothetical protein